MTGSEEAPRVVVMGVSAAGKSSVGVALAERLGAAFVDADDLHPRSNRDKMAAGVPLTDEDRWPWLDVVASRLAHDGAEGTVIACSALRRSYRDRISRIAPGTFFVHLDGDPALLAHRAGARTDHFMPPQLLVSQLATLEPLEIDEPGIRFDVADAVETLADRATDAVRARAARP